MRRMRRAFKTTNARTKYCANHGQGNAQRARRGSGLSAFGRQLFRFVHPEGEKRFTVSTTGLRGETLVFQADDGEITTPDAEIAALLRFAYLREL